MSRSAPPQRVDRSSRPASWSVGPGSMCFERVGTCSSGTTPLLALGSDPGMTLAEEGLSSIRQGETVEAVAGQWSDSPGMTTLCAGVRSRQSTGVTFRGGKQ
jgi:hypothetical protein